MSEIYSSEFIDETKGRGAVYEYLFIITNKKAFLIRLFTQTY